MPSPKIIISGGGTGGHIFPAIAIADSLKEKLDDPDILFVGAQGKMEMEKVPQAGYPIEGLWISGFQRNLSLRNLMFPFKVIQSILDARKIVKKFNPDVVIGTGGYASGPVLRVASKLKIPTLIQEQNSYAGVTNKILGKSVSKVCVAFENMDGFFPAEKLVLTGNPVRSEVIDIAGKKEEAQEFFQLDPNKKTLLIIGGSLGAKAVNDSLLLSLNEINDSPYQLVWQTGKISYPGVKAAVDKLSSESIRVHEFIRRMDLAYAAADLVISRAGAIAVSELCLTGKPCILVPLPSAAEDHQTKNAVALAQHDATVIVKNAEAPDRLWSEATRLLDSDTELQKLTENITRLGLPNSADLIADEVIQLMKH
ncbi:undecaprenyldiphospho-muramoylpentapeptide beta-N-acetylglucosaminyltransferase [bacterium SCSIO 12741]|nr:undecaprenyldiphospho-muramoylpentapeptide beta-N-acetylglucosaminyltransferase [bacterium SCSIO 12741]